MPMILAGALMAVAAYYFFSEKKEERAIGVIGGLLVISSSFINWWGRTAYIDIFVAAMAALSALFAIKGINAVFEERYKRGAVFLIIFGIVNACNLLTKAWQGLTFAPAVGIYAVFKYYEHCIDKTHIKAYFHEFKESWEKDKSENDLKLVILPILVVLEYSLFVEILFHRSLSVTETLVFGNTVTWGVLLYLTCGLVTGVFVTNTLLGFHDRCVGKLVIISSICGILTGIISSLVINIGSDYFLRLISNFQFVYVDFLPLELGITISIKTITELMFGLILGVCTSLIIILVLFSIDSFSRNIKRTAQIFRDLAGFLPIIFLGGWVLYWAKSILLDGKHFDHNPFGTVISGIVGLCLVLAVSLYFYTLIHYYKHIFELKTIWNRIKSTEDPINLILPTFIVITSMSITIGISTLIFEESTFRGLNSPFSLTCGIIVGILTNLIYFGFHTWSRERLIGFSIGCGVLTGTLVFLIIRMTFLHQMYLDYIGTLNGFVENILMGVIASIILGVIVGIIVGFLILSIIMICSLIAEFFSIVVLKPLSKPIRLPDFITPLFFLFLAASIGIASFYPFLSWIQFADSTGDYAIQKPGELYQDPNAPASLTYEWLFFEYYLGWRYEYGSPNVDLNLEGALRHVFSDPMILITVIFFFLGLYAFYHSRNLATGVFFLVWLGAGAFSFLPSLFQLSYYYLGLIVPYFCIVAKGIHWTYEKGTTRFDLSDKTERFLISTPFLIYFSYSYIQYPLETVQSVPFWNWVYFLMMASGYLLWSLNFSKTLPGILAAGACFYFFVRYFFVYKFYDHNFLILIASLAILLIFAYWLRRDVRAAGLFLIIIACMASIGNVAWFTHINAVFDYRYEEMANYIHSHGGDYNRSTRIFSNYHAEYCFGFYFKHLLRTGTPFITNFNNSLTYDYLLIDFLLDNQKLKYFVVLNGSFWSEATPDSTYTNIYRWFRENMVNLDEYVGIPWYNHIHLYGWGFFSTPRFADLDNDDDLDLIIGNITGSLRFFENTGSAGQVKFEEDTSVFSSIKKIPFATPTFGDLDGDKDLDMFVGTYGHKLLFYNNTGSEMKPSWAAPLNLSTHDLYPDPYFPEFYCLSPQLIDFDHDGDLDLIFGNRKDNTLYAYLNNGTVHEPNWIFNGSIAQSLNKAPVPAIVDINNDGNYEYLIGDISGHVNEWIYHSDNGADSWVVNNTLYFFDSKTEIQYYIDVGYFSSPQFSDFNADGLPDLVIGAKDGSLHYFENTGNLDSARWEYKKDFFNSLSFLWDRS
ncbi:MAG: FG-GAP-like repeat-containing protein [Promethearchaeota archaeon]